MVAGVAATHHLTCFVFLKGKVVSENLLNGAAACLEKVKGYPGGKKHFSLPVVSVRRSYDNCY
jgi:hypothetical protein